MVAAIKKEDNFDGDMSSSKKEKLSEDKENKEVEKKNDGKDGSGPPKAMVMPMKPEVLIHVIEGFVIQESSEPFEVVRPGADMFRKSVKETLENGEPPKKKPMLELSDGKEKELATCQMCGKTDLKSKFKKAKRFCSLSCAKR